MTTPTAPTRRMTISFAPVFGGDSEAVSQVMLLLGLAQPSSETPPIAKPVMHREADLTVIDQDGSAGADINQAVQSGELNIRGLSSATTIDRELQHRAATISDVPSAQKARKKRDHKFPVKVDESKRGLVVKAVPDFLPRAKKIKTETEVTVELNSTYVIQPRSYTGEDLEDLWSAYKIRGDLRARHELIQNYSHLVKITVGRLFTNLFMDSGDAISVGNIGLMKAVDHFDQDRGTKFETYAIALIRGAILEEVRESDFFPRSLREFAKKYDKTMALLESRLGRPPEEREIMSALGISEELFHKRLALLSRMYVVSLDDPLGGEGHQDDSSVLGDLTVDKHTLSPDTAAFREAISGDLENALSFLRPKEQTALDLYYKEGLTFREIGKKLGVSEPRAYNIHKQGIIKLKKKLKGWSRSGITSHIAP